MSPSISRCALRRPPGPLLGASLVLACALGFRSPALLAQTGLRSLKTVQVPAATGIDLYVKDARMLVVLGKAMFWDVQAGSDNRTACATCHFHAGADHRRQNQLASPRDVQRTVPANRVLTIQDFPFRQFADPGDRASPLLRDTRLVAGSAGVPHRQFVDASRDGGADRAVDPDAAEVPRIGALKIRQVTPRNTPTVVNAALNVRNFHDGRASELFSGRTPFGESDKALNALVLVNGALELRRVRIEHSSLASQAMGPPLNPVEMSYAGRTWPKVGRKMLRLAPLASQQVAPDDSVLGDFANPQGPGLRPQFSYATLIRAAFREELWASSAVVDGTGRLVRGASGPRGIARPSRDPARRSIDEMPAETIDPPVPEIVLRADEFTQMEFNFPIFWGVALQAYQATLISDDSRFDQFADGRPGVLTALELEGLSEFRGASANCSQCHGGPEFTAASFTNVAATGFNPHRLDDFGFFRLGISPVADDIGAGGKDDLGFPFFPAAPQESARGTFKTPSLRNVELTGPYFHHGGAATLAQVMDFYARQSDFPEDGNLPRALLDIRMGSRGGRLIAFLNTLTDDRVRFERAPFDHPSLCVPAGHPEASPGVLEQDRAFPGAPIANDAWVLVPAVGRRGNAAPLQTFEELLLGVGNDGSRAHTMTTPCNQAPPTSGVLRGFED